MGDRLAGNEILVNVAHDSLLERSGPAGQTRDCPDLYETVVASRPAAPSWSDGIRF